MRERKRVSGSDFGTIDANVITEEEYEGIPELKRGFSGQADEYKAGIARAARPGPAASRFP